MPELTHVQKTKILRQVVLGGGAHPPNETPDEAAWRKICEQNVADIYAKGFTPEIPWDSHDPDDEPEPPAPTEEKPKTVHGEIWQEMQGRKGE